MEPNAIISIAWVQENEPKDLEEGETLFHSQMWVNGAPLCFIIDRKSQKNHILKMVVKCFGLLTMPHPQPYAIGWIHQGRDLCIIQQYCLPYIIKPFMDDVFCDVSP